MIVTDGWSLSKDITDVEVFQLSIGVGNAIIPSFEFAIKVCCHVGVVVSARTSLLFKDNTPKKLQTTNIADNSHKASVLFAFINFLLIIYLSVLHFYPFKCFKATSYNGE